MTKPLVTLFLLSLTACTRDAEVKDVLQNSYVCKTIAVQNKYSRIPLLESFEESLLQGIASIDIPTANGAMGRNKAGYFHVRFQMGISSQADYAVYNENTLALEYAIKAIEYAFVYQLEDGNFELVVPQDLASQTPQAADVASGVSFFLSSLGLALTTLDESTWYHSAPMASYKNRIELLRPKIDRAAAWLQTQQTLLEVADQEAPNRLFFNALAFYSLGKWLGHSTLQATGLSFAKAALSMKHPNGYFLENGGWDSSYQGVGINVGFNLYSVLPETEILKTQLWDGLSCASDWQKSRILENGEISTQGNKRVYPGGEDFLGTEKKVDWVDTMLGFFIMGYYSRDNVYLTTATKIRDFYN